MSESKSKLPAPREVELRVSHLLIRPYRAEDVDALYEAVRESIPELAAWMPWAHPNYSIEESRGFVLSRDAAWANEEEYGFGIFEAASGKYLGGVGINQFDRGHQRANLGYWVRTTAAGRGVASTAAREVARFGFETLGLVRIEIVAAIENIASQRAAEKTGARREATARKRLIIHGEPHDAAVFSLVAEDLT